MSKKKKKRKVTFEEYQKAMEEIHDKHKGFASINRHLFLLLFFCCLGIVLYVLSDSSITPSIPEKVRFIASRLFIPYIIGVCTFYLIFLGIIFSKSLRCPKCRRFFPKGELELFDSFKGTGVGYNSSGDAYFRSKNTRVYWTECKYCGHIIWVIKGG